MRFKKKKENTCMVCGNSVPQISQVIIQRGKKVQVECIGCHYQRREIKYKRRETLTPYEAGYQDGNRGEVNYHKELAGHEHGDEYTIGYRDGEGDRKITVDDIDRMIGEIINCDSDALIRKLESREA